MQLKKHFTLAIIIASVLLSGCKDKGEEFIGKWKSVNPRNEKIITTIDIKRSGDIFHIDVENQRPDFFDGKNIAVTHKKFEAKAESEDVLSLINVPNLAAFGGNTLRLENNTIYFSKDTFNKVK
ncbi:hypothetical protein CI266_004630 [Salmonella enterica subsp. enterica serovar Kotte]|nr:hypothetical protein [Salmonella enterica subsp. enterica serovar Kotte]